MPSETAPYADLAGQTALVTGSSRNLGRAIAVALGDVGMNVGVTARTDRDGCEATAEAVESAGGQATVVTGDLADPDGVRAVVDSVRDAFGPVDALVNNAAVRPQASLDEIDPDEWARVHDLNLRAPFLAAKRVAPAMRDRGRGAIVNVLGQMALRGRRGKVHVAASKTGLLGLSLSLAAELGPDGVRTNAVVPGRKLVTESTTESDTEGDLDAVHRSISEATPLRRRGETTEVARAVRFLVSGEASYVNAEVMTVDGGLHPIVDLENVAAGL